MRLPAKFGSVYKLKGNRHKPWCAKKTTGYNEKGQPIYFYVGYFKTRTEAITALSAYNSDPTAKKSITFGEICDILEEEVMSNLSKSSKNEFLSGRKKCAVLNTRPIRDINLAELKTVVQNNAQTEAQIICVRQLLSRVFQYAAQNEYISTEKAHIVRYLKVKPTKETNHVERVRFTKEEIEKLEDMGADIAIMLIYTGVRVGELLSLKIEDVHLDEQYFSVRQAKTKAGVRNVPIARRILSYFERYVESGEIYLLERNGRKMPYTSFLHQMWRPWMSIIGVKHTCHDTRHTFISMMTEAGVDERILQAIVGHAGNSITEKIYTHISLEAMIDAVNRI